MPPDIKKYRHHIAHLDLDEQAETELIQTVWNIIQNGFDRALGDDPVQLCLEQKTEKVGPESRPVIE
ncbi:hypothetical protein NBRC116602_06920 [Hyphomicrobiales bacterium 4NK60-0047b]